MSKAAEYLDNEWFVVRHSGELPEVAFHSSLHYLTEAEDGPRLSLADHHLHGLKEAAMARYCDIILRDITVENRHASIYRGVKRAIINHQRLKRFCRRQGVGMDLEFRELAAKRLTALLAVELAEHARGEQVLINCSFHELCSFAAEVGLDAATWPAGIEGLCAAPDPSGAVAIV